MYDHVKKFVADLQLTEKGLPEDYPRIGVLHFYGRGDAGACYSFRQLLANRIYELSELPLLPPLTTTADFSSLPSFFKRPDVAGQERVAVGPLGTNVVYVVAPDKIAIGSDGKPRGATAEEWRPFLDKPQRSLGLVTQNALTDAGQLPTEYRQIELSEHLLARVKEARKLNSPVLVVLDLSSLHSDVVRSRLADYDDYDGPHIGLVTAGGADADKPLIPNAFPTKYDQNRPHHIWTVPPDSQAYEKSVERVVSGLRAYLQKLSGSTIPVPPSTMPGL